MADGVTIGQAAAFAGVTVKTVRHYHQRGLLGEPPRDRSGYRRYGSDDLLRLVQIRTLAAAGLTLAEIGPMLDVDAEQFAAALTDAQQRLTDRIEDLMARRDRLHRLADSDRALLPDRALELLDRMRRLGFTPDAVTGTREDLVLGRALFPEHFDDYLTLLEHRLDDTEYVALSKRSWEAAAWEPDDPRIDELATYMADHFLAHPTLLGNFTSLQARTDTATRYKMINHHRHNQASAWTRLTTLTETKLRSAGIPIPPP